MISTKQIKLNKKAANNKLFKDIVKGRRITMVKAVLNTALGELEDKLTTVRLPSLIKIKITHNRINNTKKPKDRTFRYVTGKRDKHGKFTKGVLLHCLN